MEQQPLHRVQAASAVKSQEVDRGGRGAGVGSTLPGTGTLLAPSWGMALGPRTTALP